MSNAPETFEGSKVEGENLRLRVAVGINEVPQEVPQEKGRIFLTSEAIPQGREEREALEESGPNGIEIIDLSDKKKYPRNDAGEIKYNGVWLDKSLVAILVDTESPLVADDGEAGFSGKIKGIRANEVINPQIIEKRFGRPMALTIAATEEGKILISNEQADNPVSMFRFTEGAAAQKTPDSIGSLTEASEHAQDLVDISSEIDEETKERHEVLVEKASEDLGVEAVEEVIQEEPIPTETEDAVIEAQEQKAEAQEEVVEKLGEEAVEAAEAEAIEEMVEQGEDVAETVAAIEAQYDRDLGHVLNSLNQEVGSTTDRLQTTLEDIDIHTKHALRDLESEVLPNLQRVASETSYGQFDRQLMSRYLAQATEAIHIARRKLGASADALQSVRQPVNSLHDTFGNTSHELQRLDGKTAAQLQALEGEDNHSDKVMDTTEKQSIIGNMLPQLDALQQMASEKANMIGNAESELNQSARLLDELYYVMKQGGQIYDGDLYRAINVISQAIEAGRTFEVSDEGGQAVQSLKQQLTQVVER